jgi:hypothetical protein
MNINNINVELSEHLQRNVNAGCEYESEGTIDGFSAGYIKCRGGGLPLLCGRPPVDEYNTLWVILDRLTKVAHLVPYLDTMKPEQLADSFILHILHPYRLPNSIISDQGLLFTSRFWIQIMGTLGMIKNLSIAFHPKKDRQKEQVNGIIEQYL